MKQGTLLTLRDPSISSLPKLYLRTSGWAEGRACRTPARGARPALWGESARQPQCLSRDAIIHIYRHHHRSLPPFIPSPVVSYLSGRVVSFLPHISHGDESQREVSQPELSVVTQEVRIQDRHLDVCFNRWKLYVHIYTHGLSTVIALGICMRKAALISHLVNQIP